MTERLGRSQRITAEEAQQRLTSPRPAQALREPFAMFFATIEPFAYYELVLKRKEKGAIIRERLMRFVEENALEGVHYRGGQEIRPKNGHYLAGVGAADPPGVGGPGPARGFFPWGRGRGGDPATGGAGTGGGEPRSAPTRGRAVHHGFRYPAPQEALQDRQDQQP